MNTYENPIIFGNFADPSILRDGEDYFMVHGGTAYRSMLLWHSRNLIEWEPLYYVFEGYEGKVWAPEIVKVGDTYYIYNYGEESELCKGGTWVITTKDIYNGPWSKPISLDVVGIDPGHVIGEDGKRYLFMSKNIIYPLSDDGLNIVGEGIKACDDWQIPEDWDVEGVCTESPKLMWKDGWCYLIVAEGGTVGPPTSHAIISFRSKSVYGPWESSPYNPISHTLSRNEKWWSKGHGTLIDTIHGEWYIVYHGILNGYRHLGRMTLLEHIEWTEDGWFKTPSGINADSKIERPLYLPEENIKSRLSDDFSMGRLGLQWNLINKETVDRISFCKEGLVLKTYGKDLHGTNPILCMNINKAQHIIAELTVDDNASGGITFYYNSRLSCGIALDAGVIKLYNMEKTWIRTDVNLRYFKGNHIFLMLKNDHGTVSPWYSYDGKSYTKINICFDITNWNHNSDKGHGYVRPGIFAAGEGSVIFHSYKYIVNGVER